MNDFPFFSSDGHHGEPVATSQHDQILQRSARVLAEHLERDGMSELAKQAHLDLVPARARGVAVRIVVAVPAIERRWIGMARAYDLHRPVDTGHIAARMMEKRAVPDGEIIAQHVARLVVSYSVPAGSLSR